MAERAEIFLHLPNWKTTFYLASMNPKRRSIRLPGYDYASAGWYFVTILCRRRQALFGEVREGEMVLNEVGKIVEDCWLQTESVRKNCVVHDFIIMPNHIHGIIELTGSNKPEFANHDSTKFVSPSDTIGSIVRGFKIMTIKKIKDLVCKGELQFALTTTALKIIEMEYKIWHRNYHEHIIRNDDSYRRIANYIAKNPQNWQEDEYFPVR
jgi:REP element-mobilizing transposase RayT